MKKILNDYNINGPIHKFINSSNDNIRSPNVNKKENNSKMSGHVPTIKLQNDESGRNKVKVSNPVSVDNVDIIRDSDSTDSEIELPRQVVSSPIKKKPVERQLQPQEKSIKLPDKNF